MSVAELEAFITTDVDSEPAAEPHIPKALTPASEVTLPGALIPVAEESAPSVPSVKRRSKQSFVNVGPSPYTQSTSEMPSYKTSRKSVSKSTSSI